MVTELFAPVLDSIKISLGLLLELLPVLVKLRLLETSASFVVGSGVSGVFLIVGFRLGLFVFPGVSLVVSASSLVVLLGLSSAMSLDSLFFFIGSSGLSLLKGSLVLTFLGLLFSLVWSFAVSVSLTFVGHSASH